MCFCSPRLQSVFGLAGWGWIEVRVWIFRNGLIDKLFFRFLVQFRRVYAVVCGARR
jgi:hypothetical protein